jgi:4-hydroxy-2-oxoglutarate aldolase
MRRLEGVFAPLTTPFRGDDVATDRLSSNIQQWNVTELAGYVLLGSAGEFPMLNDAERDRVLVAAREATPRTRTFLAGTGAHSTVETIRQTKRAAEIGADVALVITPHYYTTAFAAPAAQVRHYHLVADASPIPVMIENVPLDTGVNLDAETVARIASHPNVCGITDASGNISQCAQTIDQTPKTFDVLVGSASALLPSLAIGASGGVLALALIAARDLCDIYALGRAGRWDEARAVVARTMVAERGVSGRYGIGGLKAALDLQGLFGGRCRAPLTTPDADAIEDVKEVLATAGLL